jgi:hypothetical protein
MWSLYLKQLRERMGLAAVVAIGYHREPDRVEIFNQTEGVKSSKPAKSAGCTLNTCVPSCIGRNSAYTAIKLRNSHNSSWNRWLAAFRIPFIGRRLSTVIAKTPRLQPEDLPNLPAKFATIKIGEIDGLSVSTLGELQRFAKTAPSTTKLVFSLTMQRVSGRM